MRRNILIIFCIIAAISARGFEMLTGSVEKSEVYPGTVHAFSVSVPDGYDPSEPACLYVGLDGPLYGAPAVIDSLVSCGAMPMTIGVYFQPGVVKNAEGETVRYNRSNEYDAVDDRLAGFIETELLPAAEALTTTDGRPVRLTRNPDGRSISGASSGGIGAFVVAWQRPDLFRRVYTTCGTFVAMRGGDLLPAIVRKTEPLPLRLFIHDGSRDAWNPLFGHWYEQNRLLASSLEFAGYDVATRWDDTGHSIVPGTRLFPEAMAWLWRDYPDPVRPHPTANNSLAQLLAGDTGWHLTENADCSAAPLEAAFPDSSYTVRPVPGTQWIEAATAGEPDSWQKACLLHDLSFTDPGVIGLAFDTDGNLYAATACCIQVCDQNGRVRAILRYPTPEMPTAFGFEGSSLKIRTPDGTVWCRTISATAAPGHKIIVKPQGPA